jgi:hypothetical protein
MGALICCFDKKQSLSGVNSEETSICEEYLVETSSCEDEKCEKEVQLIYPQVDFDSLHVILDELKPYVPFQWSENGVESEQGVDGKSSEGPATPEKVECVDGKSSEGSTTPDKFGYLDCVREAGEQQNHKQRRLIKDIKSMEKYRPRGVQQQRFMKNHKQRRLVEDIKSMEKYRPRGVQRK